jgi:hypothetical protein
MNDDGNRPSSPAGVSQLAPLDQFRAAHGRDPVPMPDPHTTSVTLDHLVGAVTKAVQGLLEATPAPEEGALHNAITQALQASLCEPVAMTAILDIHASGHTTDRCATCKITLVPGSSEYCTGTTESGIEGVFADLETMPWDLVVTAARVFCSSTCRAAADNA